MSDVIDDVTIVGGGDSGLLTALALRQLNPGLGVSVVDDFSQDIPQVGKSTYLKIRQILHDTLDIDERRFISAVKPVWKASVYFRDWCDREFHYPFDASANFPIPDKPDAAENYYYYYDELYRSSEHLTRCEAIAEGGKSPWYFHARQSSYERYDKVAYHLNTERFNAFLRELCRERDVSLVDDEIVGVEVSGNRIERVRSKRQSYESDLYVDATGFSRVLKGELDAPFREFEFPLDSALNVRVERPLSEVIPATVVESGEYGWFWHIDTYDNRDLGYVYASEYVSEAEARREFVEHCEGDVEGVDSVDDDEVVRYEFSSGYHDPMWEGNCVAIGNAAGFVEPLQSTGLTANAHAAVQLSRLLSAHNRVNDDALRDAYNAWVRRSWESIYDFISVHYRYSDGDGDTAFWDDVTSMDLSPRVELLAETFDDLGFVRDHDPTADGGDVAPLQIFTPLSFHVMLRNLGVTSDFYESGAVDPSEEAKREADEVYSQIAEEVDSYLTTEEMYKSIIEG